MATAQDHQDQATHNAAFYDEIDGKKFPDWAATVMFYTAVHLVQRLFALRGGRGGYHKRRNDTLKGQYPNVWKEYHKLYSYSRLARYRCMAARPDDVSFLESRLNKVRAAIEKLLK